MPLSARFEDCLVWASQLHRDQVRKGTTIPYVAHLLAVASLVLEHGGDEDLVIAALLHDAVEDQGGQARLDEIRDRFGARVARVVEGCTDAMTLPKPPWRARKQAYLEHLPRASAEIRLVSCADKLHNARSILLDFREHGDDMWSRFTAGREGVLWYYGALRDVFTAHGPVALARELHRVVEQIQALVSTPER
ncbi:MAG: HD domain-containing protein [Pseudomonadota bacterium]